MTRTGWTTDNIRIIYRDKLQRLHERDPKSRSRAHKLELLIDEEEARERRRRKLKQD